MRIHLWPWHIWGTVVIMEEGNLYHRQCPVCDMLVPLWSLILLPMSTSQFKKGVERKQRRLAEEEEREVTSRAFSPYRRPLDIVPPFKYPGRLLSSAYDDWAEVIHNPRKARRVWWRMPSILIRKEARPRVSRFFLKSFVQSVFLFGAETWVVAPCMGRVLGFFKTM